MLIAKGNPPLFLFASYGGGRVGWYFFLLTESTYGAAKNALIMKPNKIQQSKKVIVKTKLKMFRKESRTFCKSDAFHSVCKSVFCSVFQLQC
jgi:hypothetical protein